MLAQDILTVNSYHNTLSGPCKVLQWEGKDRVRILFPSGYSPLVRADKLLNGTIVNYGRYPANVVKQLEESADHRLLVRFADGEYMAFPTLQTIADYTGQHRNSIVRVYKGLGYSSIIDSVKDILN